MTTTPRVRRGLLIVAGSLAGILLLDLHKVSIAIPSIERSLHPGPVGIQLIQASYVVLFALTLIPAGRLGDRGRRVPLIAIGLLLYIVASLVCTLAPDVVWIVIGRSALGVAAGILMPQAFGLVQSLFVGPERARAFGIYGVCVSISTALGPSVGGLLITVGGPEEGWRAIFAMNVPIGLAIAVACLVLLPHASHDLHSARSLATGIDPVGLGLAAMALLLLLAPFITTTGKPSDPPERWLALLGFAAFALAFVAWTRRRARVDKPTVVDLDLLALPSFRNGVLISLTWFASGPGFALALTVYLQTAFGLPPVVAGLLVLPSAATSALGAAIGARWVIRLGRRLTAGGMLLSALGMIVTLVLLSQPVGVVLIGVPLVQLLMGFGGGLVVSPNHSMTLMDIPRERGGAAGSLGQLAQRISNSVGVAIASVAFFSPIYGAGFSLDTVPADVEFSALVAATVVALGFLVLALVVAVLDLRRQEAPVIGRTVVAQ